MSKILILNVGSSSVKYKVYYVEQKDKEKKGVQIKPLVEGIVEEIGNENSRIKHQQIGGKELVFEDSECPIKNCKEALDIILCLLANTYKCKRLHIRKKVMGQVEQVIQDPKEIIAVGHRVVHGGERFITPIEATPEVLEELNKISKLAPLHNPGLLFTTIEITIFC